MLHLRHFRMPVYHCRQFQCLSSQISQDKSRSFSSLCTGIRVQPTPWAGSVLLLPNTTSILASSQVRLISVSTESSEGSLLIDPDVSSVVETLGEPTFQSIGLAHAYPSGLFQYVMEQIHLQGNLPWWATIVITTVLIRVIVFPVVIKAQKNMTALNNVLPEYQRLQVETLKAASKEETLRSKEELDSFIKKNNIHPIYTYAPMFCQGAFFTTMFFALRGMANCPVESMKYGGLYWFTDLTVQDPFFLLPIMTSGSLFLNIYFGADGVDTNAMAKNLRKFFLFLPLFSLVFMINFPTALNLYWLTTNLIAIMQSRLLRLEPIRKYFGIGKIISWRQDQLPLNQLGIFGTAKLASSNDKNAQQFGPYAIRIMEAETKAKEERAKKLQNNNKK